MTNIAIQRIQREFREVASDEASRTQYYIETNSNDLSNLIGYIIGPPDTPYEGGRFYLEVKIPDTYPFSPPKVKFSTRIWHPNISSATGAICLDILKDQWAAAMTIRTVLLSLQTLLAVPEASDPQDAMVARQYMNDIELFKQTARYWTYTYALPSTNDLPPSERLIKTPPLSFFPTARQDMPMNKFAEFSAKVRKLAEFTNLTEPNAMHVLCTHSWNLEAATHSVLS